MQRAVALAASKPFDEFRQMELLALRDSEDVRRSLIELRRAARDTNMAVTIQADAGEKKRESLTEGAYRENAAREANAERATTGAMLEAVRIRQRYERLVNKHGQGTYPPPP